jgi:archaellum biogenesis protein FlaJ (TadC family)
VNEQQDLQHETGGALITRITPWITEKISIGGTCPPVGDVISKIQKGREKAGDRNTVT